MGGVLMLKNSFLGAALTAVLLAVSSPGAKASTVFGFYSLDGGTTITALADGNATDSIFTFSGALGNFNFNSLSAFGQPNAGPNLLSVTGNSNHDGEGTDTLRLYFVASDLAPGGSLTFTESVCFKRAGQRFVAFGIDLPGHGTSSRYALGFSIISTFARCRFFGH